VAGASITVHRPLEWIDTDAAGIWHFSTVVRYAEYAEMELHRALGVIERTAGVTPRVHVEFDFHSPVRFGEEVATTLTVTRVGRSSITYEVVIEGEQGVCMRGRIVSVLLDEPGGGPLEVPDDLRSALTGGARLTGRSFEVETAGDGQGRRAGITDEPTV